MQSPPSNTRTRRLPYAILGGGVVAAAAIVGGFMAIPAVSGANGAESSEARALDEVTSKPELGSPRDPLSPAELSYAIHLASTDASVPDDVTSVDGSAAPQVLSVDIPTRNVDSPDRLVDVFLFDYTSNQTFLQTVDLTAGSVESTARQGVQPPPSPDEVDYAFGVFLGDPAASAAVRAEYAAVAGEELESIDQLAVTGGAFVPDAGTLGADACSIDRCVEMQFRVPGGGYLDTTGFVVDLSTESVIGIK
ncbi:hypothetical protein ESP57_09495 [Agromyces fucosus]|uniref:Tat pathway signal sequence domain protein n=1 Tax=Agromyces fucosus TaxID=41985 RepID=A0A4V1QSQ0_9MICO|nr:hypothetical protein [Agromyces fucosus]RXZ49163.1 hypothetical protein ESP57_09495 [Agromyces fucosus]